MRLPEYLQSGKLAVRVSKADDIGFFYDKSDSENEIREKIDKFRELINEELWNANIHHDRVIRNVWFFEDFRVVTHDKIYFTDIDFRDIIVNRDEFLGRGKTIAENLWNGESVNVWEFNPVSVWNGRL